MTTLTNMLRAEMPFTATLDLTIVAASAEAVVAATRWAPDRCTAGNVLHGGYIMAAADATGAACAAMNLPANARTTTIESKTNFIRAVREGDVTITATPLHVGSTTIVVQTDTTRSDGRLVARTIQTQAVLS